MRDYKTFEEALADLEKGYTMIMVSGARKTAVARTGQMYKLKAENFTCTLDGQDFFDLYNTACFYNYTPSSENLIDPLKDEEYYRWTHK